MYKISKSIMEIAPFHARTERGVRQELFAHFNLMAMTRIFTIHGDAMLNARKPTASAIDRTANFKNFLAAVARNLEALLLKHAATVAEGDPAGPRLRRHRAAEAAPGTKLRTTIPKTPQPLARQAQESIDSLNHRTPKRSPNMLSGLRILK